MKMSKPIVHKIKVDEGIVVIYQILISLQNYFNLPEEVAAELQKLIIFLENKYFPLPQTSGDIEILDTEYMCCTKYCKILD